MSRISSARQQSASAAGPGRDRPARREGWRVPLRSWPAAVWRRPLPGGGGIRLEPADPVQGGVRDRRAAWLLLALAVTAVAAAQYAAGGTDTTLAWLAIAPLLGSLVLAARLAVLVLLAAFAVANSVLRGAAQRRLGQARAVARVAQSALLREVPQTVATARLASRYPRLGLGRGAGGGRPARGSRRPPPALDSRRHQRQRAARGPAGQRRHHQLPGCLRPAGPVAGRGGPGG